jgi:hypothetical protein
MKHPAIIGLLTGVVLLLALVACSDDEDDPVIPDGECRMTGTVTALGDPLTYQGGTYVLYIDIDSDPDNANHEKSFTGTFPDSVLHYDYDISDVTPGTYYLHMTMDLGGGVFHVGYYGATPNPWDVPAAANADVFCDAVLDFDIYD